MWKWTDPNNIKAIIIDCDSVDKEIIEFDYASIINNVNIYYAKNIFKNDLTLLDTYDYFDEYDLISKVLKDSNCSTYSVISISCSHEFIKSMMQYHIGTVFGDEIKKEFLENVPDYTFKKDDRLKKILNYQFAGYAAEVIVSNIKNKRKSLLSCKVQIQLDNGTLKELDLYFGGRYYSESHKYLFDDPLSTLVRSFKKQYIESIDDFFDSALQHLYKCDNSLNLITYVPLKKSETKEKFDRFDSLKLPKISRELEFKSVVKCVKDFHQKENDYFARQNAPIDAFEVVENVQHKNIILLDDVYTTGATVKEIAKVLYEAGANHVIALLLAVNQTTESSAIPYKRIICPICGHNMRLKMGVNGLFFGCENYKSHPTNKKNINFIVGIKQLKELNKLDMQSFIDLDDEY